MNNIFLSQPDPLLQNSVNNTPQFLQVPVQSEYVLKDWVGELDDATRSLDDNSIQLLNSDENYIRLSSQFQQVMQAEIMILVKSRLNSNPEVVNNIKQQLSIINNAKQHVSEEQRRNICELNDYVKNYSHLTFDEYKKIKQKDEGRRD